MTAETGAESAAAPSQGKHGVLVVDKPRGPTSHDIVSQARRLYGTRAVGHAGTLDPMATGVLVLLLGEATKLSGTLTAQEKRYRATVSFGCATDTLDADGRVTETVDLAPGWLDPEALHAALEHERSRTAQVPPSFSARKVAGRRAHRLVRQGASVELAEHPVAVLELTVIELGPSEVVVEATVSKGYYVRALARDLGAWLRVPAHLSTLRRLQSGGFGLAEATAWPPPAPAPLIPVGQAAARALPVARLSVEGARRAHHGQLLSCADFQGDPTQPHDDAERRARLTAWLDPEGRLAALGVRRAPDCFAVVRGFRY